VQAKPGVIDRLNTILTIELTAINQYFVQSEMCRNWGYDRLAEKFRHSSMEEMKDTPGIIAHILYLEGIPNMQRYLKVNVGQTVAEQLTLDLQVEHASIRTLNAGIELCRSVADNTSRELLERILESEEHHTDWLETQLELIRQVGEQNYLAQQIKEDE